MGSLAGPVRVVVAHVFFSFNFLDEICCASLRLLAQDQPHLRLSDRSVKKKFVSEKLSAPMLHRSICGALCRLMPVYFSPSLPGEI